MCNADDVFKELRSATSRPTIDALLSNNCFTHADMTKVIILLPKEVWPMVVKRINPPRQAWTYAMLHFARYSDGTRNALKCVKYGADHTAEDYYLPKRLVLTFTHMDLKLKEKSFGVLLKDPDFSSHFMLRHCLKHLTVHDITNPHTHVSPYHMLIQFIEDRVSTVPPELADECVATLTKFRDPMKQFFNPDKYDSRVARIRMKARIPTYEMPKHVVVTSDIHNALAARVIGLEQTVARQASMIEKLISTLENI